jgi:hypothetical protein
MKKRNLSRRQGDWYGAERGETRTDGDGRFSLTLPQNNLGEISRYRILASRTSDSITQYAISDWLESRNGEAIDSVVLVLGNGLTLKGRTIDRDGGRLQALPLVLRINTPARSGIRYRTIQAAMNFAI